MSKDTRLLANLIKNMKAREEDPLRPIIDLYMLKRQQSPERLQAYEIDMTPRPRPGGRLSPSSMGGCERQAAFKFLGMPGRKRVDPDLEILFDDGDWRHHRWQATFRDMEIVLGKEIFEVISIEEDVSHDDLYISGSIDAVVRIYGVLWVIDFKGINSYGFKHLKDNNRPDEKYVFQILTYMRARKIKRGILFFEDKNNQETRSFIFNFDAEEWAYLERWAGRVIKMMNQEELPEKHPECTKGHFLWGRCPFADHCFGSKSAEQVRKRAYRGFVSVEDSWQRGHQIIKEHNES